MGLKFRVEGEAPGVVVFDFCPLTRHTSPDITGLLLGNRS